MGKVVVGAPQGPKHPCENGDRRAEAEGIGSRQPMQRAKWGATRRCQLHVPPILSNHAARGNTELACAGPS